jgi:cobalt-zinc-cadmium efflux system membrane fusion protein
MTPTHAEISENRENGIEERPLAVATAEAPPRRPARRLGAILFFIVLIGAGGGGAWAYPKQFHEALSALIKLKDQAIKGEKTTSSEGPMTSTSGAANYPPPQAGASDDGVLTVSKEARDGMRLVTVKVAPQVEPINLELLGTTEYDSDNQTKIRPLFKGRVDKVYATVGTYIKKGDPLIEFYSVELAQAKMDCEIQHIQWNYSHALLGQREKLWEKKAISEQLYLDSKNTEMQNRRQYEVAVDKLLVYGLTQAEVEKSEDEVGAQKARMVFRSPTDGIVILRDVVPGNIYDEDNTLLVIEPLDHLWVWGNVFESDLDLVKIGQPWEIEFPFMPEKILGKVGYISNTVDPGTHTVRIRTSIPNKERRLKSAMLVRGMLQIPVSPKCTGIPRMALVTYNGLFHAFVQDGPEPGRYRRVTVTIAQEKSDHVIVQQGLKPGDIVVTDGSLILDQMFENAKITRVTSVPTNDEKPAKSPG